jgi:hypothetical protein
MLRKLRMLTVVIFLLCVFQATSFAAEGPPLTLNGYWGGIIERQGAEMGIRAEFKTEPDGIKAVIDIPDLYIHGYKLSNVRYDPPNVRFELPLGRDPDKFDGAFKGEAIEGTYSGRFYQAEARSFSTSAEPALRPGKSGTGQGIGLTFWLPTRSPACDSCSIVLRSLLGK